jgi:hypothetical protein
MELSARYLRFNTRFRASPLVTERVGLDPTRTKTTTENPCQIPKFQAGRCRVTVKRGECVATPERLSCTQMMPKTSRKVRGGTCQFIISSEVKRSGSFSTRPFIFVPLDSAETSPLPFDMSFRSKADRVIGQLQLKILGTEIKDDSSTRKASLAVISTVCARLILTECAIRATSCIECRSVAKLVRQK